VRCRIIDRAPERSRESRALAIFPRTLETFETMGVAERFLAAAIEFAGSRFGIVTRRSHALI
jgi:2-polyprenyl-6-methoxyphenol hydroxylase-like FAD-dependent oxidoreductase